MDRLREALNTLPLPHRDFTPTVPVFARGNAISSVGFTLSDSLGANRLSCYGGGGRTLPIRVDGNRISIDMSSGVTPPRARLNCTHPAANGAWYWLGWQAAVAP